MILDKIIYYKKDKVEKEKLVTSLSEVVKKLKDIQDVRDFKGALAGGKSLNIIAEVKKASPSKGVIKEDFNPRKIAVEYEKNKVNAISVVTEDKFFLGKNNDLSNIRKITTVPLLRKDFIIDEYQIYQSKVLGADGILLIATVLTKKELIRFQAIARQIGIHALVEVHSREELDMVLETDAEIIGINNRDLKTFHTTIENTEKILPFIPKDKVVVSESGIKTNEDMRFLQGLGVNAVLIGEGLMKANSIGGKLKELKGGLCD